MHLEKDILKGKKFGKGELRKEAVEELEESKKGKRVLSSLAKDKALKRRTK